jgi:hypothetical protein
MRFEACGENSSNLYGSSLIYRMSPNIFGHFAFFWSCLAPSVVQVDHHHQVTSQRAHAARWQVDGWDMANAEIGLLNM